MTGIYKNNLNQTSKITQTYQTIMTGFGRTIVTFSLGTLKALLLVEANKKIIIFQRHIQLVKYRIFNYISQSVT